MTGVIRKRLSRRLVLGSATAGLVGGWNWPWSYEARRQSLIVAGAARMLDYNQLIATQFMKKRSDVDLVVEAGGAYPALLALKRGSIDIAATSGEIGRRYDDPKLRSYLIARDAIAIIVNPKNPVDDISPNHVRGIFENEVINWGTVGGRDEHINLIDRGGSDTSDREELAQIVLGHRGLFKGVERTAVSDDEMHSLVAGDPDALGFCGWEDVTDGVKAVSIGGVPLNRETILSGRYPYSWPYYFVTYGDESPAVKAFIAYAQSEDVQSELNKAGLVRVY